jgi:hypothetical protein
MAADEEPADEPERCVNCGGDLAWAVRLTPAGPHRFPYHDGTGLARCHPNGGGMAAVTF